MRGANAEAVRRIGIEVELPKSAKGAIVLNVNTPFADSIADSSLVVDISTHEDKLSASARLVLPMAHHSERDSSMINRDGILQYCPRALNPSKPLPTLEEWLAGVAR
jgi:NADH dehydrogenase/NADH:ubiquinone oxidoreductase subunit G